MKKNKGAFTLIEVLLSTLIISAVLTSGFYALTYISIWKIRLVESTKIQKEWFYFSEKLFEMIKQGWVLDFEEYFNRKIVWNTGATAFSSGHYSLPTGYGNFWLWWILGTTLDYWAWLYYCISPNGSSMGTGWCVTTNNVWWNDHSGAPQRYGQYAAQFIDYNSDYDDDWGDEDGDLDFAGDDDDEYLGQWPDVFVRDSAITELYLISWDRKSRTLFRWNVELDPNRPTGETCDFSVGSSPTGTWCLGTVEFLVLDGVDWWYDHSTWSLDGDGSQYDGIIDTWIVNSRFSGNFNTIAGSGGDYREKLFPSSISVSDFEVYAYPNKDINLAWKDGNNAINQAPYLRLKLTLKPSWQKRKTIQWKVPSVEITTTIALTDEFSK